LKLIWQRRGMWVWSDQNAGQTEPKCHWLKDCPVLCNCKDLCIRRIPHQNARMPHWMFPASAVVDNRSTRSSDTGRRILNTMSLISLRRAAQSVAPDSNEPWFQLIRRFFGSKALPRSWTSRKLPKTQNMFSTTTWASLMAFSQLLWRFIARPAQEAKRSIASRGGQDMRLLVISVKFGLVAIVRSLVISCRLTIRHLCTGGVQIGILRVARCLLERIFS
jgi:hypothetical protein